MKRTGFIMLAVLLIAGSFAFTMTVGGGGDAHSILEIGTKAPMTDVAMKSASGESLSMTDLKMENGLLVIFTCNTCPFVVGAEGYGTGWQDRYNELTDFAKRNNIGTVLVNSNEAKRGGGDSPDAMKTHAEEQKYHAPYVIDEGSEIANAFGAKTTPHVYLFNGNMELAYKGAIDDNNADASKVTEPYLMNALTALSKGETIDPNSTRHKGCSIKRAK
jgi:peroxiredoxin